MALVLADRVKETTTSTGTGTVTLAGASTGYQSFSVIGDGNTTYYVIAGQGTSEWEVGIGTYTLAGTTLARTTVLASSNAGSLVTFSSGTKDVFVSLPSTYIRFQESQNTSAPNATVYVSAITSVAGSTDADVAFVAKGTGATLAQVPDSTTTGGNKRGTYATDWQKARGGATKVASGAYSVIGGGYGNSATTSASTVGGGDSNNITVYEYGVIPGGYFNSCSGYAGFVGGGQSNNVSANYSVVAGGISNTASSQYSFVGGGYTNKAQTNTYATVVGGANNIASGQYSFVGGGGDAVTAGNRNTASGLNSTVVGGKANAASGDYSTVMGGFVCSANNTYTVVGGYSVTATGNRDVAIGADATASGTSSLALGGQVNSATGAGSSVIGGYFGTSRSISGYVVFPASLAPVASAAGVSQAGLLVLGVQTTNATPTVLRSNTSAAGTTNQVILPNNSAYYFKGSIVAGVTGGGNSSMWSFEGGIKRGANAAATTLIQSVTNLIAQDAGASAWVVALSADTTNGGLAVTVTGAAATTIRWVCKIETTEMTY